MCRSRDLTVLAIIKESRFCISYTTRLRRSTRLGIRASLTVDAPQYLWQLVRVADVPSRHRLRSSTSDDLIVPALRLTSVGSRAFPAAGAGIWNTLPLHVTSASSFKQRLKLHLFGFSFPGLSPV